MVDEGGRETLRYAKAEDDVALRKWALLANPMLHSTTMYRRALIFQCGLYDESLRGFQDWDVFLKLGQLGKLQNINAAFVSYTMWTGGGSFQGHVANTKSALRIVLRHRRNYPGFYAALPTATLHYLYALLPRPVKQASFAFLSRTKKTLFSGRRQPTLSGTAG